MTASVTQGPLEMLTLFHREQLTPSLQPTALRCQSNWEHLSIEATGM